MTDAIRYLIRLAAGRRSDLRPQLTLLACWLAIVGAVLPVGPAAAQPVSRPAATEAGKVVLHFGDGAGVVLPNVGAFVKLQVTATSGGRGVAVPGGLEFTSSDPAVVTVGAGGGVIARQDPGSAVITVTSTAAKVVPAQVTVVVAQLAPGVVNLDPSELTSVTPGHLVLVRDHRTQNLQSGTIVVAGSAGLVARLSTVSTGTASVSASTTRVPLGKAFSTLSVALAQTSAPVPLDASLSCSVTSGSAASISVVPPDATLSVTAELDASIMLTPGGVASVSLEPGATVSGSISLGRIAIRKSGSYRIRCAASGQHTMSLPLQTGLPGIGSLAVTVRPQFTATMTASSSGPATYFDAPVTGSWTDVSGIAYTSGQGWASAGQSDQGTGTGPIPVLTADTGASSQVALTGKLAVGLAVSSDGQQVSGIGLGWVAVDVTAGADLTAPFSDLDVGYTGPVSTAEVRQSRAADVGTADSSLRQLLTWIGVGAPSIPATQHGSRDWTFARPSMHLVPPAVFAGHTATLDAFLGDTRDLPGWEGASVDFVLFPAGATTGQQAGTLVASATIDSAGDAAASWQVPPSFTPGSYRLVAELELVPGAAPMPTPPSSPGAIWSVTQAPLPPDAAGSRTNQITSVACPSATSCVAVGSYDDAKGNSQGLVLTGSGTSWTAARAPLPSGAGTSPDVSLSSVSCATTASCVAVGSYTDTDGVTRGLLLSGAGSGWTAARAPIPAGADPGSSQSLSQVSCPGAGSCVAIGSDGVGVDFAGFVVTGSGTSWTAVSPPLPADADTSDGGGELEAIACPDPASCVIAGNYPDTAGISRAVLLSGSGSTWTASEAPVLASAAGDDAFPESVACSSATSCTVVGLYFPPSPDSPLPEEALLLTGSGTSWTAVGVSGSVLLSPPLACEPGGQCVTMTGQGAGEGFLVGSGSSWKSVEIIAQGGFFISADLAALAFPAARLCLAAGASLDSSDTWHSLLIAGSGALAASWQSWTTYDVPPPAGVPTTAPSNLGAAACASAASCTAIGTYDDSNSLPHGYLLVGPA